MRSRVAFGTLVAHPRRLDQVRDLFGSVFGGELIELGPSEPGQRMVCCNFFEPGAGQAAVWVVQAPAKFQKVTGLGVEFDVPDAQQMIRSMHRFAAGIKGVGFGCRVVTDDPRRVAVSLKGLVAGEIVISGVGPTVIPSARISHVLLRVCRMVNGGGVQRTIALFRNVLGWSGHMGNGADDGYAYSGAGMGEVRVDISGQPARAPVIPNESVGIVVDNPEQTALQIQRWAKDDFGGEPQLTNLDLGVVEVRIPNLLKTMIVLTPRL